MRKPDENINDYLHRWYVIPSNKWFNIYLHRFLKSDRDRDLHDHPWYSVSFLLKGSLIEMYSTTLDGTINNTRRIIRWLPVFRTAKHQHRLVIKSSEVWTLFITGPKIREWGFWPDGKWVYWKEYIYGKDYG